MNVTLVGRKAPNFKFEGIYDDDFLEASLSDYNGKIVLMLFYPHDFCPSSRIQLHEFSDKISLFTQRDVQILAISTDSKFTHLSWYQRGREENGLGRVEFPLLCDHNHDIGKLYGVYNLESGLDHRSNILIDPNGIVQYHGVFSDYHTVTVDDVLKVVDGYIASKKNDS